MIEIIIKTLIILSCVGFWAFIFYWLYSVIPKNKVSKIPTPTSPEKKTNIKDVYEFLETRALNLEGVNEVKDQVFPLWVNIGEVYYCLSMYHNEEFQDFFKEKGLCYDHGFGCDADDHWLPEFPAAKSKKSGKYPDSLRSAKKTMLEMEAWCYGCNQVVRASLEGICNNCNNHIND